MKKATKTDKVKSDIKVETKSLYAELVGAVTGSVEEYKKSLQKSARLRLTDTFLGFLVALGVLQFVFCCLVGSFPFNAFLAGFCATVAQFVLTVSLRMQYQENKTVFGEYIIASLLLHFIVYHFIN